MVPRTATVSDLDAILEMATAFYAEDGFTTPRAKLAEHLRQLITSAAARVAVLESGAEPVAFAISTSTYGLEYGLSVELEDLYVVPAARRRGLAQHLIDDSARWARRIGASQLVIVIAPNGQDVRHLHRYYQARGFDDDGRRLLTMRLTAEPDAGRP